MSDDRDADPIPEFCKRHGFSRGKYYQLPPEDRPREMRIGNRVLITREEGAAWRARMVEKTAQKAVAAADLLTSDEPDVAVEIAARLEWLNEERRRLERELVAAAEAQIAGALERDERRAVIEDAGLGAQAE